MDGEIIGLYKHILKCGWTASSYYLTAHIHNNDIHMSRLGGLFKMKLEGYLCGEQRWVKK